jgi:hypothetical protein
MVGDASLLQDVDGARSASMVMDRAEDAARLDCHHPHAQVAPCHALDLRANRTKQAASQQYVRCLGYYFVQLRIADPAATLMVGAENNGTSAAQEIIVPPDAAVRTQGREKACSTVTGSNFENP